MKGVLYSLIQCLLTHGPRCSCEGCKEPVSGSHFLTNIQRHLPSTEMSSSLLTFLDHDVKIDAVDLEGG